jgi:hypothetical protein
MIESDVVEIMRLARQFAFAKVATYRANEGVIGVTPHGARLIEDKRKDELEKYLRETK